MTKRKLIADGTTGGQSSLELTGNNPDLSVYAANLTLIGGIPITITVLNNQIGTPGTAIGNLNVPNLTNGNIGNVFKLNGPEVVEVINNGNITITSNDLPLENIIATSGTIQLNNNYTGNVKTAVQVGNNSIISLTGIELPLSTVIIEKDAIFSFTHNNTGMQINTLNDAINTPNLVIKDIHTIVDTANFLNNIFNNAQGFQGNVNEGIAARIYKKNKETVKLFMTQNNMDCNDVAIDQYFDQKYLITSALAQAQNNWGDFAHLPLDVVGNIFSESAYI